MLRPELIPTDQIERYCPYGMYLLLLLVLRYCFVPLLGNIRRKRFCQAIQMLYKQIIVIFNSYVRDILYDLLIFRLLLINRYRREQDN